MTTRDSDAADAVPRSTRGLRNRFRTAHADALPAAGTYRAVFVGPALLRVAAPRAIALGGMPRWYGKRFAGDGTAVNLLADTGGALLQEKLPMRVAIAPSWLDGHPAIVVSYGADAPVPWRWVRDEFRTLDERTLLGLTFAATPASRVLASPFTLVRDLPPHA
ncbi:hypothetical protein [Rhodococcus sp. CH91]|uniref:hypothetical protein n=1 Tax=Rhodococcus sp. CH91 TaxID=2910256 RepID=UPI001F4B9357|nr:hypothetical protein [Rhodococcus sp. CH91]